MSSLAEVVQAQGWTLLEPAASEGAAQRARVEQADGQRGLLYVWPERAPWANAQLVASPAWAGQLFAVPDGRWSSEPERALLVEDVEGLPLDRWLATQQHRSLGEHPLAEHLLEQLGVLFRKLHSLSAPELHFGPVAAPDGAPTRTFSGYVASTLERAQSALSELPELEAQHQRLVEWISDLRYELSSFHPRHPASLNHGAPSLATLWVDPVGPELIALTGFGQATFLPAEADVAALLWLGLGGRLSEVQIRAFYKGYGAARTMDVQRRERFYRRYVALLALTGQLGATSLSREALLELASPGVI